MNQKCSECKEGCVLGKSVYCNYDGHFHSAHEALVCEKFEPKDCQTGL